MQIPKLRQSPRQTQTISTFGGYEHNLRIPDGYFYEMENMTSDHYPMLASRQGRSIVTEGERIDSISCNHGLCWVEEGTLYLLENRLVELGLTSGRKNMISMGAYLIILPDKKWVNVAEMETTDRGELSGDVENVWENASNPVELRLCDPDGTVHQEGEVAKEKPTEPFDGQLWQDDTVYPAVLKRWNQEQGQWFAEESICLELRSTGIGNGFFEGDTVSISLDDAQVQLQPTGRILKKGEDFLVIRGYVFQSPYVITGENALTLSRKIPDMDLVIECGNRLWGCKYGVTEKGFVNEIYCSSLGDFRNWQSFEGLSTDSYVASIGVDGPFTGAVAYQGRPLFFKENSMIEVFGSYPANFQIRTTPCDGVQRTCDRSLAVVNNVLYYKSRQGVCAYDGSMPVQIGMIFGPAHYTFAVACAWGNKYCMAMSDHGKWSMFLYDTICNLWHRESIDSVSAFAVWEDSVYCLTNNSKTILDLTGNDGRTYIKETVEWMVETGPMGLIEPESRYVTQLSIRLWLDSNATASISCRYDNEPDWVPLAFLQGTELGNVCVPIYPRRCDFMRLKLEGQGLVRVYAITKTWEEGGSTG